MTTTTPSAALVPAAPVFTNTERLALAGFLPGWQITLIAAGAALATAAAAVLFDRTRAARKIPAATA
jgi:hypothetical protein